MPSGNGKFGPYRSIVKPKSVGVRSSTNKPCEGVAILVRCNELIRGTIKYDVVLVT